MVNIQFDGVNIQLDLYAILVWVVVGLIAGFLASRVMLGHGMGVFLDVLVGIAGAIIGNVLATYFNIQVTGPPLVGEIAIAFLGALVLLLLLRLVSFRRRRR